MAYVQRHFIHHSAASLVAALRRLVAYADRALLASEGELRFVHRLGGWAVIASIGVFLIAQYLGADLIIAVMLVMYACCAWLYHGWRMPAGFLLSAITFLMTLMLWFICMVADIYSALKGWGSGVLGIVDIAIGTHLLWSAARLMWTMTRLNWLCDHKLLVRRSSRPDGSM